MMERKKHSVNKRLSPKINQRGDPGNMTNENLRMKPCLAVKVVGKLVGWMHMLTIFT